MEFQVRHVGGIENCFVSLPIQLIQTLEVTRPPNSPLPNPLVLELRPAAAPLSRPWTVSWSGATSSSPSSIEIAAQFAECMSIPDGEVVRVRAVPHVEKAELVTIEPVCADDWEVMENMSVLAEAVMLQQVRVVHEAMRFPMWLHGHSIATFVVVSILPKNSVVQLGPQSEVAVAPKRRKREDNGQDTSRVSANEQYIAKALLRVQDSDGRMFCNADVKGFDLGVEISSVAYVHPDTAEKFSLAALQLFAVVPRFPPKESMKTTENGASRVKSTSAVKGSCNTIIRLLFSSSVAKGHIMISQLIQLYLRVGVHTWVYVKGYPTELRENFSTMSFSPCYMKKQGQDKAPDKYDVELLDDHHPKDMVSRSSSGSYTETGNSSIHDEVVSELSRESPLLTNENASNQLDNRIGLARLFRTWFLAQLDAISSVSEGKVGSLILGKETLLHFKVDKHRFWSNKKAKAQTLPESTDSTKHTDKTSNASLEFTYLLTISDASVNDGKFHVYNIGFDDDNKDGIEDGTMLAKLKIGDPVSVYIREERASVSSFASDLSSLSWMGAAASDVINRAMVLLSPELGTCLNNCNLPLPGHVLIHGPHIPLEHITILAGAAGLEMGSGKTILAQAVAKSLEKYDDLLAHIVYVSCSGLAVDKISNIRQTVSGYISEALDHAPSLIILDDVDSILSSSSASEGSQPSNEDAALAKFFSDLLDEYAEKRNSSCGFGPVAFIASVQTLESIPQPLTSSGRFDFHVQLPAPAASERGAILKHEITRRSLKCSDDILFDVASKCDGYDAYDLEILVDRTVHAAIGRFLPSDSCSERHEAPKLNSNDFSRAMNEFVPVAMRDVTKAAPDDGRSGWEDVGGLTEIRNAIKELGVTSGNKFKIVIFGLLNFHGPQIYCVKLNVWNETKHQACELLLWMKLLRQEIAKLRSNVLLYGPPGCGKTHIVGAAAAGCSLRFISVKGPELLNKYIGASEQAVRDIFSKAAAAAPCILFFDEFDSIAPKRGHDNTGVTDRVVNQFLTELDGFEVLTGVFVFAATSRPDLLDAALLRPGRLDRLLFCDFPSPRERLDILAVLSKKLPLASDVDLESIAYVTEGFSGADLQALLSDAQLAAVHEHLNSTDSNKAENMPVISDVLLKSIASKARPSISDTEKQRLYGIYGQFLDSKRSVAAQSRDAKGKRATLA